MRYARCVTALGLTHVRGTRLERLHGPSEQLKLSLSKPRSADTSRDRVAVLRHVVGSVYACFEEDVDGWAMEMIYRRKGEPQVICVRAH